MIPRLEPLVTHADGTPVEGQDDEAATGLRWWTLLSADRTATRAVTAGVAELDHGLAGLERHRHATDEVYHFLSGVGEVLLGDGVHPVRAGTTMFIPADTWHGIRNTGDEPLRLFYCFPTDSFTDVVYVYPPPHEREW